MEGDQVGKQSKPSCPKCTSNSQVIPITYGKPAQFLIDQAKEGKVKLGGCFVSNKPSENKGNHCKQCKYDF